MAERVTQQISIVGGGIAGLALAAMLDPQRWRVTLIEAEPGRGGAGAAIGLWPSARRALVRIGAWDALADSVAPADGGAIFDLAGHRVIALANPGIVLVDRPRLIAALQAAVPPSVTRCTARIEDPRELAGDVVVGADGVRSVLRGLVHPPAAARIESPYVALRGLVASCSAAEVGEYWGPGRLFGLAPMSGGRGYWFTTHRSTIGPEPLDPASLLIEARREFADAAPVIRATLADAGQATLATRMWTVPAMPRYVRGRYLVIGDAAHGSLPNLGRGGCDALLDAVTLADTLNRDGSLLAWQARRLPATQAARLGASALMHQALSGRGGEVRNRLLRRLPSRPAV